jgi:hypothetical protein
MTLETFARDLTRHLDARIETVLRDFMDRCAMVGIDYDDATALALTVMGHHTACAAHGIETSEYEYLAVCHGHYVRMEGRVHNKHEVAVCSSTGGC